MINGTIRLAGASNFSTFLTSYASIVSQTQVAEDVPAAALLPQLHADIAKAKKLLERGVWSASEPRDSNITISGARALRPISGLLRKSCAVNGSA